MMVDKHRAKRVKLTDIIEGMDCQSEERSAFLNLTTGDVVSVTDEALRAAENDEPLEDFPAWQHDAIRFAGEIVETDHYLPLPDKFEINEYRIMERFCFSVDDDDMRDDGQPSRSCRGGRLALFGCRLFCHRAYDGGGWWDGSAIVQDYE